MHAKMILMHVGWRPILSLIWCHQTACLCLCACAGVTTWARHGFAALTAEADPFTCEGCEKEGRCVGHHHGPHCWPDAARQPGECPRAPPACCLSVPLLAHCRVVVTDHGSFVLFNVYVPNAGDRPERARLPAKLSFLSALKERVDELRGAGRQVRRQGVVRQHCAG